MSTTVSIGDFSLMTHLSIKTLRYYHQVGLLAPAEVDPDTGAIAIMAWNNSRSRKLFSGSVIWVCPLMR